MDEKAEAIVKEEQKVEERDRLKDMIRARIKDYELLGEYEKGPKNNILKIRRWSYGLAVSLSPKVAAIGKSIFSLMQGADREKIDFKSLLGQHLADIAQIIAGTLATEKTANGFKTDEEVLAFVMELDPLEIWDIGQIIYQQNFEFFIKNRASGLVKKAQ